MPLTLFFSLSRIAFQNAIVLAHLLNRTLLVPPIQLGSAVAWAPRQHLLQTLLRSERSDEKKCRQNKNVYSSEEFKEKVCQLHLEGACDSMNKFLTSRSAGLTSTLVGRTGATSFLRKTFSPFDLSYKDQIMTDPTFEQLSTSQNQK